MIAAVQAAEAARQEAYGSLSSRMAGYYRIQLHNRKGTHQTIIMSQPTEALRQLKIWQQNYRKNGKNQDHVIISY
jgi:hypothetical protein